MIIKIHPTIKCLPVNFRFIDTGIINNYLYLICLINFILITRFLVNFMLSIIYKIILLSIWNFIIWKLLNKELLNIKILKYQNIEN
jgi:hypothetical protein